MKVVVRFVHVVGLLLVLVIVAFVIFVASRQHLTFEAPYPEVAASNDSAMVARGRYLVRSVALCGGCHGDPSQRDIAARGEEIALRSLPGRIRRHLLGLPHPT